MDVRAHSPCLFSLVLGVKLEVQSVFKEKIAQGDGLIGWKDRNRKVEKTVILLLFSKQACLSSRSGGKQGSGCLILSWTLMKLVRGITESGGE